MNEESVNGSMAESSADLNTALANFGVPKKHRSLSDRVPFLYGLSGYDPARVRASAKANGGMDWLPYGWAR